MPAASQHLGQLRIRVEIPTQKRHQPGDCRPKGLRGRKRFVRRPGLPPNQGDVRGDLDAQRRVRRRALVPAASGEELPRRRLDGGSECSERRLEGRLVLRRGPGKLVEERQLRVAGPVERLQGLGLVEGHAVLRDTAVLQGAEQGGHAGGGDDGGDFLGGGRVVQVCENLVSLDCFFLCWGCMSRKGRIQGSYQ